MNAGNRDRMSRLDRYSCELAYQLGSVRTKSMGVRPCSGIFWG